jgi:hypothetical protein
MSARAGTERGPRIAFPISLVAVLAFLVAAFAENMDRKLWDRNEVLKWDVAGYYHYLPALFINGDISDLRYVWTDTIHARVSERAFGIHKAPSTGRFFTKFSCGTAIMQLPFFWVAHDHALSDPRIRSDGYSAPYALAVQLSTVFYVVLGMFLLRSFLLNHVNDLAAAIPILVIGFGTNLFFYSTLNAGMSHGYLFFLYALVLYATDRWRRSPRLLPLSIIAFACGLTAVTRPVDGLIVIIPILGTFLPVRGTAEPWRMLLQRPHWIAMALVLFFLPLIPQFMYWKAVSGQWLFYSYGHEGFDLRWEKIWWGLFSFRKGWFIYSPLVILGLIGLYIVAKKDLLKPFAWIALIYLPIYIVVVFSWHQWWYGGGFGARPMVNVLPLLALPIAVLAEDLHRRYRTMWWSMLVTVYVGIRLNLFQLEQFPSTIMHYDSMTMERYFEVFLEDDWHDLRPFPQESDHPDDLPPKDEQIIGT